VCGGTAVLEFIAVRAGNCHTAWAAWWSTWQWIYL